MEEVEGSVENEALVASMFATLGLDPIAKAVERGERPSMTVRELLKRHYWCSRRGSIVVQSIREDLKKHGLITFPSFEDVHLDTPIEFRSQASETAESDDDRTDGSEVIVIREDGTPVPGSDDDPSYRIGRFVNPKHELLWIQPDKTVKAALTEMLRHDYSQLPVMSSERNIVGVISYRSIAQRSQLGASATFVREMMDTEVRVVSTKDSLFEALPTIHLHDFVFVSSHDKRIIGIITASDLVEEFRELTEPFLLLGEIENYVRKLIEDRIDVDALEQKRNPTDSGRKVEKISDLTFGEYLRVFEDPEDWNKLGINLDRPTFVKQLHEVRDIRNEVMHFDPDPLGEDALECLSKVAAMLRKLIQLRTP